GVIGYFAPRTLGVGYDNIDAVLTGALAVGPLLSLCVLKFASWSIALGSGTSGGTLAPLFTIGGRGGPTAGTGAGRPPPPARAAPCSAGEWQSSSPGPGWIRGWRRWW